MVGASIRSTGKSYRAFGTELGRDATRLRNLYTLWICQKTSMVFLNGKIGIGQSVTFLMDGYGCRSSGVEKRSLKM